MTPTPSDPTSTWLVAVTAVAMGFLACLALAAATSADDLAESWTAGLERRATVALAPRLGGTDASRADDVTRAVAAIQSAPGVMGAAALAPDETRALLDRALGPDLDLAVAAALPDLIDVRLSMSGDAVLQRIERRLEAAGFEATVDAHGGWAARLEPAAARLRALGAAALGAVGVASALLVALATAFALSANARTVRVLSLVGAQDGAIARLFERRFQSLAFIGSAIGTALGAATLALFAAPLHPEAAAGFGGGPAAWALFALLPLAFAAIATAASRGAVALTLRRRPA